jgi:hypothetical protein
MYEQVATQTCLSGAFANDNNIPVGNVLALVKGLLEYKHVHPPAPHYQSWQYLRIRIVAARTRRKQHAGSRAVQRGQQHYLASIATIIFLLKVGNS